jgi:hypothetical protein
MKSIVLAACAFVLTAASANAQTVISRQVKSQPVETVVTRQQNRALTTSQRVMNLQNAAMRTPQRVTAPAKPQTRIVYRTIVQREIVQAPQPQMVVVREPVTRWVPSILPPFSYPVTSYENRVVYTTPAPTYTTPATYTTTYTNPAYATLSTSYPAPSYRVVEDDDDLPGVRAYTTPVSYVVRY